MKRVRITIDSTGLPVPPLCHRLARHDTVDSVEIVNWNFRDPPAGFLYRVRGNYELLEASLDESPHFTTYEILPQTDRECYCFAAGEVPPKAQALFENFSDGSLLVVPPIAVASDGTYTATLVGTDADLQAAVGDVPESIDVTIEAVGGTQVAPESVLGSLSPRQREAMETALVLGYYEEPRNVSVDAIAAELGCSSGTAAEHLRKAESTIVSSLFDVSPRSESIDRHPARQ